MELITLALVGLILVGVVFFGLKKKPPEIIIPPFDPDPDPGCGIELLGIDVRMAINPPWWNPASWPLDHFPSGSALCFQALVNDCDPYDAIKPLRYSWYLHGPDGRVMALGEGAKWCYSGEMFFAGSCGDIVPKKYAIRCAMTLTNGETLVVSKDIWAVSESACRR